MVSNENEPKLESPVNQEVRANSGRILNFVGATRQSDLVLFGDSLPMSAISTALLTEPPLPYALEHVELLVCQVGRNASTSYLLQG
jgi:hypothetical protein